MPDECEKPPPSAGILVRGITGACRGSSEEKSTVVINDVELAVFVFSPEDLDEVIDETSHDYQ